MSEIIDPSQMNNEELAMPLHKNIINLIEELPAPDIDMPSDLKAAYYEAKLK